MRTTGGLTDTIETSPGSSSSGIPYASRLIIEATLLKLSYHSFCSLMSDKYVFVVVKFQRWQDSGVHACSAPAGRRADPLRISRFTPTSESLPMYTVALCTCMIIEL